MKRTITPLQILFSFAASITLLTATPNSANAGAEPFIGEMSYVAFNYAPRDWAKCDGQLIAISQNQALYALLGTAFGGDGRSTFGLPDMRGRVPIHQGTGPGLPSFIMGSMGGQALNVLSIDQMPQHTHPATANSTSISVVAPGATATSTLKAVNGDPNQKNAQGNSLANGKGLNQVYSSSAPDVDMNAGSIVTTLGDVNVTTTTDTTVSIGAAGASNPFSIMQPYTTVNCIISLDGIFPPRQ